MADGSIAGIIGGDDTANKDANGQDLGGNSGSG